ncbi:hypothetical protein [Moorena sp. SIO3H5]|nr:hypothetical protein [Moorena sp. SIO3H5]NEO71580.1 hypothetical protein [Moorena sp. SIO3H5]
MQRGLGEPVPPKGVPPMSNWRGFPHSRFASRQQVSIGLIYVTSADH